MRVAVLADLGQPVYHVGDEAIAHAVTQRLQARGVEVVLLTRDVAHTHQYHRGIAAEQTLQFPWPPSDAERYLAEIRQVLAGRTDALPGHDQVHRVRATIADADALLLAGGGNLNSTYRWLLYERVATALIASRHGKPVVLTGQTLGPALIAHDRALLAEMLNLCALVSLREQRSVRLARELAPDHPAILAGLDDASFWPAEPAPTAALAQPQAAQSTRIVGTFAPGTGPIPQQEALAGIAALLDGFAVNHDLRIDLVPHMATPGASDVDLAWHNQIVAASTSGRLRCLPLSSAREAALEVTDAGLVVTSRYHPAVFATATAVPVFALVPDHYADVRIQGALDNVGLPGWAVPLSAVLCGAAAGALDAAWAAVPEISAHLRHSNPTLRDGHEQRWDDIVTALSGEPVSPTALDFPDSLVPPDRVAQARQAHLHVLELSGLAEQHKLEAERAQSRLALLETGAAAVAPSPGLLRGVLGRARRLLGAITPRSGAGTSS